MIAAILCGGKGERLRSVIGEHQKCAVDVGGRPWIHRVLDFLYDGGIEKVKLLTGYKAEEIEKASEAWMAAHRNYLNPYFVECLHSEPSGTEKAVALAFSETKEETLLIVNGDTLIEGYDLRGFLAARKCVTVRGPSVLSPKVVDSGLFFRFRGCGTKGSERRTRLPFIDIGTPRGLAKARRRFSS